MSKLHYKAVILVLSSDNNTIYKNAKSVWKKYMNTDYNFRVFFVYGKLSEQLFDQDTSCDLIYEDIKENYPVFIEKTIRAMEFINQNFTYDYFIRTNLTTFWDFKNLHKHLDTLPKDQNFYSGDGPLHSSYGVYLSGTDTIVSRNMIDAILNNKDKINYNLIEDVAMGIFFHGILKAPLYPNRIVFFEDVQSTNETDKIVQRIEYGINSQKDHYRVKSRNQREELDLYIYKILLKEIYNINL
jgi:hypothetical protein